MKASSSALDATEILDLIREAIRAAMVPTRVPVDEVRTGATLAEIGLDSMGAVEVAARLEEALGIRFPDDQLARVSSVEDLIAIVQRQLRIGA